MLTRTCSYACHLAGLPCMIDSILTWSNTRSMSKAYILGRDESKQAALKGMYGVQQVSQS
jgi:hypothetical protein